LSIEQFEEEL